MINGNKALIQLLFLNLNTFFFSLTEKRRLRYPTCRPVRRSCQHWTFYTAAGLINRRINVGQKESGMGQRTKNGRRVTGSGNRGMSEEEPSECNLQKTLEIGYLLRDLLAIYKLRAIYSDGRYKRFFYPPLFLIQLATPGIYYVRAHMWVCVCVYIPIYFASALNKKIDVFFILFQEGLPVPRNVLLGRIGQ